MDIVHVWIDAWELGIGLEHFYVDWLPCSFWSQLLLVAYHVLSLAGREMCLSLRLLILVIVLVEYLLCFHIINGVNLPVKLLIWFIVQIHRLILVKSRYVSVGVVYRILLGSVKSLLIDLSAAEIVHELALAVLVEHGFAVHWEGIVARWLRIHHIIRLDVGRCICGFD